MENVVADRLIKVFDPNPFKLFWDMGKIEWENY